MILSIPDRLREYVDKLLRLRFPIERHFSGRDLLLAAAAVILLVFPRLLKSASSLQPAFCSAALLCAAVPQILQALHLIRNRRIPAEEICLVISSLLAFLAGEKTAGVLILVFADFLCQVEGYSLLHRDAAKEAAQDFRAELKKQVENAEEEKSSIRRILASASFAYFALFLLAAVLFAGSALFHPDSRAERLHSGLVFLVLSIPSGVIMSSVLTHFGILYSSAKADIAFRDDGIPERFAACRVFAFSKTGTVTDGRFIVSDISSVGISDEDLLRIAAIGESCSTHPIAAAVKAAAGLREGVVPEGISDFEEIPGRGVSTFFSGHHIYVGNAALLEEHDIWCQIPAKGGAAIHVAVDGVYRGYMMIADSLRESAFESLEELRAQGAVSLIMLTGDVRSSARTLASSLNFDMVKPELRPEEKGSAIRFLRSAHADRAQIACVGDGFHDGEMFAESDVSVCFDREVSRNADIHIFSDDLGRLPLAYRICRNGTRTLQIVISVLAAEKLLLGILGAASVLPLVFAAAADFVFQAGAVIWSLTCLTLETRR